MRSVLADGSHCQMQPFAILAPTSAEKERTTPLGARTSPFCSCTLVIFQAIETALTRIQYLKMIVRPLPFFVKQKIPRGGKPLGMGRMQFFSRF